MTDSISHNGRPGRTLQIGSHRIIVVNSFFLGFMAVFGASQDILSYLFGSGRFGTFLLDNSRALGFVEAHGLAGVIAVAAFVHAGHRPVFWHALLGLVHAFLGSCNLLFFDAFMETGEAAFATLITVIHFAISAFHVFYLSKTRGSFAA